MSEATEERKPFQPKGDVSEKDMLLTYIRAEMGNGRDVGATFSYDELSTVLGRDFLENRAPIYAAVRELERTNKRTLINERLQADGSGGLYRIAHAREHERLVRSRLTRSRRQAVKGISTARAADRSQLTGAEARKLDDLAERMSRVEALGRRTAKRQELLEGRQESVEAKSEQTESRVEHLERMLKEKGIL